MEDYIDGLMNVPKAIDLCLIEKSIISYTKLNKE
jgi:hypothetical protein